MEIVMDNVVKPYDVADAMALHQYRHALNSMCGGTARVQHLWQVVLPELAAGGAAAHPRVVFFMGTQGGRET